MENDDSNRNLIDVGAVGLLGAVTQISLGGHAGTVVAGVVTPVLMQLIQRANRREVANAERLLEVAGDELACDMDSLYERIIRNPRAETLVDQAVRASVMTALDGKIDALGRAVSRGLDDDDAQLDVSFMLVAALSDMEIPHIRVLEWFADGINRAHERWDVTALQARSMDQSQLRDQFPGLAVGMDGIMAVLERHGLITLMQQDIGSAIEDRQQLTALSGRGTGSLAGIQLRRLWKITELGWELLVLLRARGNQEELDLRR